MEEKSNWIIYAHKNKINNKVYIGQTKQVLNNRWRNGEGYKGSIIFYNAIKKYGWDNFEHLILEDNLETREDADKREKYWIQVFNSRDRRYGYNEKEGGQGYTSEEAREQSLKNWNNPSFREKFTKKVICTNTQKIYPSIVEASEATGISKSSIEKCCTHKHLSGGVDPNTNLPLVWEFYEEGKKYSYIPSIEKNKRAKKVICLTTGEIFPSVTQAAETYNCDRGGISSCCTGKRKTAGQLSDGRKLCWAYYNENEKYSYKTVLGNSNGKKVICLNTGIVYNSIKEASDNTGVPVSNISSVCHGRGKSAGKLNGEKILWKFYEE